MASNQLSGALNSRTGNGTVLHTDNDPKTKHALIACVCACVYVCMCETLCVCVCDTQCLCVSVCKTVCLCL